MTPRHSYLFENKKRLHFSYVEKNEGYPVVSTNKTAAGRARGHGQCQRAWNDSGARRSCSIFTLATKLLPQSFHSNGNADEKNSLCLSVE